MLKIQVIFIINFLITVLAYLLDNFFPAQINEIVGFLLEKVSIKVEVDFEKYRVKFFVYILESIVTMVMVPFLIYYGIYGHRVFSGKVTRWWRVFLSVVFILFIWIFYPITFLINDPIIDSYWGYFFLVPLIFGGIQLMISSLRK